MYQIYKDSELYKFINCHFFDQISHWPGGYGYNFCNYIKDITLSVGACVLGYGAIGYVAVLGVVPTFMWMFGYPNPTHGGVLMAVASIIALILMMGGVVIGIAAGVCIALDKYYVSGTIGRTVNKTSVGQFVTTAYSSWKDQYCPLVEVLATKEEKDVN